MNSNRDWRLLFIVGGAAALLAGVFFRRNIGAEVSLLTGVESIPTTVEAWYALLQSDPFTSLSFLAVFDLVNYALLAFVFLALAAALWQVNRSMAAMALASGLLGVVVNLSANISLTMLSLSQQYAAAGTEAQKSALLAAGQAILAYNDPLAALPSTGPYMGLLLVALAGLLFSVLLLRAHRTTAIFGLLAGFCDLAYCLTFTMGLALQTVWLASAGLFWMIWHVLLARVLFKRAVEGGHPSSNLAASIV